MQGKPRGETLKTFETAEIEARVAEEQAKGNFAWVEADYGRDMSGRREFMAWSLFVVRPEDLPARTEGAAFTELRTDEATYRVEVGKDDEGRHQVVFKSDNPPMGLDGELYQFTGRLPKREEA